MSLGWPVPTKRALALFGLGLAPAALAVLDPAFAYLTLAIDLAVLGLVAVDFLWAPTEKQLSAKRVVSPILSSGVANPVQWSLALTHSNSVRGELRDEVAAGPRLIDASQRFELTPGQPEALITYKIEPLTRGDLRLGDLHLRLDGPLGLCQRQLRLPSAQTVKVYPDLTLRPGEGLAMAHAADQTALRTLRRPAEGREFESLRDWRRGDDFRAIDWKATAKKARPMVRVFQPERDQPVLLLLDCGRQMAGQAGNRRKLDHAVDAALRLARVCLDRGDLVGVLTFATEVIAYLPPRKGREQLRALTEALYRVEAVLQESDYGAALDLAFARQHKRTLVTVFTELVDPDSCATLVARTQRLRPRHLPLIVSLLDEDLSRAATELPASTEAAYVRGAAARLEEDYRLTATRLRDLGALVVRSPARSFGAAAVNEYLRAKNQGLL